MKHTHQRLVEIMWFPVVAAISLVFATAAIADSTTNSTKPNIVFIMADDLGYGDLGCYGQPHILTPNIDRLAEQGIRFTQVYAGGTVCAPSRSCLMTGTHGGHTRVRDNIPHYREYFGEDEVTVAKMLKSAGYRCGGIGKWSLGDAGTAGRATNQGFDTWLGYLNQDHAHYYYTEYLDDDEGRLEMPGNGRSHEFYSHDLMTERALKFIRESKDQPFFFYGAYTVPHFGAKTEDPTGFPVPSDAPYTEKDWDQKSKNYAAMITRLDGDVGRIVALIDSLELSDRTLIVFTSDNGPWGAAPKMFDSNGPLRGVKRDMYEGGIRVPFIARWPAHCPAGNVSDEVFAFWDMLPTFAELAGAKVPSGRDGISVVPALRGEKLVNPHEYLYWDYGHCRKVYHQAVRMGNWKAIRHGQDADLELYDLSQDIAETQDVAEQHADVVDKVRRIMAAAATPSDRYPIGTIYKGKPIWQKE